MSEDHTITGVWTVARKNSKTLIAVLVSIITGVAGASVVWGGYVERMSTYKEDSARVEGKVDKLSGQVEDISREMAGVNALLAEVQRQVHEQRDKWDRVEETAEEFHVPRGRRAKHPP